MKIEKINNKFCIVADNNIILSADTYTELYTKTVNLLHLFTAFSESETFTIEQHHTDLAISLLNNEKLS